MKSCVIIPARFQSSRFPGKPLVKLLGKPMIIWVAEIAANAVGIENVFIATDDIGKCLDDNKFIVEGRMSLSEIRGCNLLNFNN